MGEQQQQQQGLSRIPSTTTGMSMRQSLKQIGSSFRLRPAKPHPHPHPRPKQSTATATATATTITTGSTSHHTDSTTTLSTTSSGCAGDERFSELSSAAFRGAVEDKFQHRRRLVLTNFIENASPEDMRRLRCILRQSSGSKRNKCNCNCKWHLVKFNDISSATNYRRWQFKKDNVLRHIKDVVAEQQIVLRFHSTLEIEFNCNSADALGRLFTEVRKDPDIVAMDLKGCLEPTKATLVIPRLIHLLTEDKRHWEKVVFAPEYVYANTDTNTTWNNYAQWKHSMQRHGRQLEELSEKRGIPMGIHIVS